MVNIIITSEMRVGSRWLHYLLRDLLHKKVSGELDVSTIPECQDLVSKYFRQNKIVKFHHAKPQDIFQLKGDFKVIGIVRNPRDRVVSWTFHQRYKPSGQGLKEIKNAATDKEAVRIALKHEITQKHNKDQFGLMLRNMSTKSYYPGDPGEYGEWEQNYIWTSYRWLKQDLIGQISTIVDFLGEDISHWVIEDVCRQHTFVARTGRKPGKERREDEWFRKGVEDDFLNWFDEDMLVESEFDQINYWNILEAEEFKIEEFKI